MSSSKQNLRVIESVFFTFAQTTRRVLAGQLGKSFNGNRDIYNACGWKNELSFDDYFLRYDRQDIAARVVDAFPDATWRVAPRVYDNADEEETDFFKQFTDLMYSTDAYHYLWRLDRVAGVGRYGVLFIGFQDGKPVNEPVGVSKGIDYFRPCFENQAMVTQWETDQTSPRFGLPVMYTITVDSNNNSTKEVHYSRVIHVADNCLESDIFGTSRLHRVFNRLQDIETVAGGSAEMFWKGAFPGFAFEGLPDYTFDPENEKDLDNEISEYANGLRRYMKLIGVTAKPLTVQVADPTNHVNVQVSMISACTGIPSRILLGSEAGQLASTQDRVNWLERVDSRRSQFVVPRIIVPFIKSCVDAKVLPKPRSTIIAKWEPLDSLNETERATVGRTKSEALGLYVRSPGASLVIPPEEFMRICLNLSEAEINRILKAQKKYIGNPDEEKLIGVQTGNGVAGERKGRPSSPPDPTSSSPVQTKTPSMGA